MRLTLLSRHEITGITLPNEYVGRYWIKGRNDAGKLVEIVSVEALRSVSADEKDQWIMRSNRAFKIVDKNGTVFPSVPLKLLELYNIQSVDGEKIYTLFTEPLTNDRKQYKGYITIQSKAVITIGRDENCGIFYSNRFTSRTHAQISFSENGVAVKDLDSTNNTYVNGKAVRESLLHVGDVVYIMGLRIIITANGLFINNPDGNVKVQTPELREFHPIKYTAPADSDEEFEDIVPEYYYRAPRRMQDINTFELKVDAPPAAPNGDEMPMIMLIGPSMTMGMASIASGIFSVTSAIERGNVSSAIPSIVMCVSMLLGTLMWPLVTKTYQKRLRKRREEKRQATYTSYLEKLDKITNAEKEHQERILRSNDVNARICSDRILSASPLIWDRTPKHSDFLSLRMGRGELPLNANIQYPERKFSVEQDNLAEMMYQFGEKNRVLNDVPVCLSLIERFIIGIYGNSNYLYNYARSLILQLITVHSYDEVKLILLYDESHNKEFAFTRWLPHTISNDRSTRYIATNSEEVKILSSSLDSIIEYRKELSDSRLEDEKPYYVIICLDKELSAKAEGIRRVLETKKYIKFSVLSIFERLVDLPKECMAVAEINDNSGTLTLMDDTNRKPVQFMLDSVQGINMAKLTNVLSNTFVDISGSNFALPKKYTFFEMLDIGMIEHLNIADNWARNDPTKSLAATIGIDKYGEPFRLDLHEKAHGPHGLVAGMTGSGKSEFIISFILSMAVSFHPYEVSFILIDYKGGGMAKAFESIPHTAGVITNLDGNGIKRSLSSMRSELHRRERIFRDTSKKCNVSNIDIYKYQKLFRERKVSEPLPHLFIISDEFAELKKEQPDFMTELTSTARVGRSLGVHLILATQKPGGVVDDQIRSNSRFKICLKVQDSGDSNEMLGRPDAAALSDTGRFYLQVGYNELFEIGQSAWAGAPYYPSQKVIKDRDDAISVIDTNGRVIAEANTNRFASVIDPPKQLDVITDYIAKYSAQQHIRHWKMWLDPIPAKIYVDKLAEQYPSRYNKFELAPVAGKLDDPAHQRQDIMRIPFSTEGNAIVYGSAGSGKAMFLEALCYSIMREHTPDEVNIYCMDFGAETFTAFAGSPFIGDVILSHETEKVNNLFKLIMGKIETRKKILAQFGGSIVQYNLQAETPQPNILVCINNFAAFCELFEDRIADLNYLSREGTKYGIFFILTCTGINNVKFSMLQNFKLLYCLQMNNPDDYSSVVGKTEGLLPEKIKGRGLFRRDKDSLLEFQTASVTSAEPPYAEIRTYCQRLADKYANRCAESIPILPEKVTIEHLEKYVRSGDISNVPVGIEKETLKISSFDFSYRVVSLILSDNNEWQQFVGQLCVMLAKKGGIKVYLLSQPYISEVEYGSENLKISQTAESNFSSVSEIYSIVLNRNNEYKTAIENGSTPEKYEPVLVVIQSLSELKAALENMNVPDESRRADDDTPFNRLQTAIEHCNKAYNVHFIICDSNKGISPFTATAWFKKQADTGYGLWVGNGLNNQFRLTVNNKSVAAATLNADFGFNISKCNATLIKYLQ